MFRNRKSCAGSRQRPDFRKSSNALAAALVRAPSPIIAHRWARKARVTIGKRLQETWRAGGIARKISGGIARVRGLARRAALSRGAALSRDVCRTPLRFFRDEQYSRRVARTPGERGADHAAADPAALCVDRRIDSLSLRDWSARRRS